MVLSIYLIGVLVSLLILFYARKELIQGLKEDYPISHLDDNTINSMYFIASLILSTLSFLMVLYCIHIVFQEE